MGTQSYGGSGGMQRYGQMPQYNPMQRGGMQGGEGGLPGGGMQRQPPQPQYSPFQSAFGGQPPMMGGEGGMQGVGGGFGTPSTANPANGISSQSGYQNAFGYQPQPSAVSVGGTQTPDAMNGGNMTAPGDMTPIRGQPPPQWDPMQPPQSDRPPPQWNPWQPPRQQPPPQWSPMQPPRQQQPPQFGGGLLNRGY